MIHGFFTCLDSESDVLKTVLFFSSGICSINSRDAFFRTSVSFSVRKFSSTAYPSVFSCKSHVPITEIRIKVTWG